MNLPSLKNRSQTHEKINERINHLLCHVTESRGAALRVSLANLLWSLQIPLLQPSYLPRKSLLILLKLIYRLTYDAYCDYPFEDQRDLQNVLKNSQRLALCRVLPQKSPTLYHLLARVSVQL